MTDQQLFGQQAHAQSSLSSYLREIPTDNAAGSWTHFASAGVAADRIWINWSTPPKVRKSSDSDCRFQPSSSDLQKAWQAHVQLSQWLSFSQRTSALLYRRSGYWGKAKQNMLPRGLHRELHKKCNSLPIDLVRGLLTCNREPLLSGQPYLLVWSSQSKVQVNCRGEKKPQSTQQNSMHACTEVALVMQRICVSSTLLQWCFCNTWTKIEIPWGSFW